MNISGTTRVVVHLAYPARHLRTPTFFNPLLQQLGHDAVLVPWQVQPSELARVWEGLRQIENLAGVIVTIPHKEAVAQLCHDLSGAAEQLQVCNVARRNADGTFSGQFFDGEGFVLGLRNQGHNLAGRNALLLGAGGAATGIAQALLAAGVSTLGIHNRTEARAHSRVNQLRALFPQREIRVADANGQGYDLVVNATSLGLKSDDPLPVDPETLAPGTLVGEVVMNPDVTPLLQAAQNRGCVIHKGSHMIVGQLSLIADFLFGKQPIGKGRGDTLR